MKAAAAATSRLTKWIAVLGFGLMALDSGAAQLQVLIEPRQQRRDRLHRRRPRRQLRRGRMGAQHDRRSDERSAVDHGRDAAGLRDTGQQYPRASGCGEPRRLERRPRTGRQRLRRRRDVLPTSSLFGTWRLAFVCEDPQRGTDVLVSTTDEFGGPPITFLVGAPPGATFTPTLGSLVCCSSYHAERLRVFVLRRHKAPLMMIVAALAVCLHDLDLGDRARWPH
jgi:hypothetical protein